MKEITVAELETRIRQQYESAQSACAGGQAEYARDVAAHLLTQFPSCLELRQLLRQAQSALSGKPVAALNFWRQLTLGPALLQARQALPRDPRQAISTAEAILARCPAHVDAHRVLAEAAENAGWTRTALWAWEETVRLAPDCTEAWLRLGNLYYQEKNWSASVHCAEELLARVPHHASAQSLLKKASVELTLRSF